MKYQSQIQKMIAEYATPIQYYWKLENDLLMMNQLIGKTFHFHHTGYKCFNCDEDREILAMGYCYVCFNKVPQTQMSILKPELSKAHLEEEERDLEWEKEFQLQPHILYLTNTGIVKVGVTRKTQIPTRWIDQGATEAIKVLETENRYQAGIAEVALAQHISDKTNYKKMLSNQIEKIDLAAYKHKLFDYLPEETQKYFVENDDSTTLNYPIEKFPEKIIAVTFKNHKEFSGKLLGIKGQYLIFEDGKAFNVKNHEGFTTTIEIS